MKKIFTIAIFSVLALIVLTKCSVFAFVIYSIFTTPAVPENYTQTVKTGGEIEAKYLAFGPYEVDFIEQEAPLPMEKYEIYYPTMLKKNTQLYPVVVFVNGTGVYASRYGSLFRHLASWGFIVIGNEDPSTCTGESANRTLDYLLTENNDSTSIFHNKIDIRHIGISGHSQGGVGVFNAITAETYCQHYQTAVALSPTHEEAAKELNMAYDLTGIRIPLLMIAGTKGDFETRMVIPLPNMQNMYEKIDAPKVMMRKKEQEHGNMLYAADGYVTAWFLWQLQGDDYAARAFTGDPEIMKNDLYEDQAIDLDTRLKR